MKPTIGHFVNTFLHRSETFTYDLMRSLTGFENHVLASGTLNLDLFPIDSLTVVDSEDSYPARARELGIDLAMAHFGPVGFGALPTALDLDIPLVTVFHGYDVSLVLFRDNWIERYRLLAELGTHAICISEAGRRRLVEIGWPAGQTDVVHLGVDVARFAYKERTASPSPADPLRVLIVSRLAEKKGVGFALHALRLALDRGLFVTLKVIGEGEDGAALRELAQTLTLGESVEFAGPMNHDEVCRQLQLCHLYMQPSVTAANGDQEGIPVALMEAMASGAPVITTRHSGIPELVIDGENGTVVPERDTTALADALMTAAARPQETLRRARAARQWVEQEFNLERQAPRFASVLQQVLLGHRERRAKALREARATRPAAATRILYIRSVPMSLALDQLRVLAHLHPQSHIAVLTAASTRETFEQCPYVREVFTYRAQRIGPGSPDGRTLARIVSRRFARAIVPIGGSEPTGYENVLEMVPRCGAGVVSTMTPWHVLSDVAGSGLHLVPQDPDRARDKRRRPAKGAR